MRTRRLAFLAATGLVLAWTLGFSALAAESPSDGIWISSIDRPSQAVRVLRGGQWMNLSAGAPLITGDLLEGLPRGLVTLRTPDRGVVVVAAGTVVEVERTNGTPRGVRLKTGALRGMFGQAPGARNVPKASRPLRFLVRSRTAVMGVRGTDFLIDLPPEGALNSGRLLTFEGTVEAAPDEATLVRGEGMPVATGQKVQLLPTGGVSSPLPIEPADFNRAGAAFALAQLPSLLSQDSKPPGPTEPTLLEALPSLAEDPAARLSRWSLLEFHLGVAGYRGIRVVRGGTSSPVQYLEGTAGPILAGELSWSAGYRACWDRLWLRAGLSLMQAVSGTVRSSLESYGPETLLGWTVGLDTRLVSRLTLRTGLLFGVINGFNSSELNRAASLDLALLWRFRERSPRAPKTLLRGVWLGARNFPVESGGVSFTGGLPADPWIARAGIELGFGAE